MVTKNPILAFVILSTIFLGSFLGNVVAHEFGHYVAADLFDKNPDMHLEALKEPVKTALESKSIAYVEFDKTDSKLELSIIALMGPLVNLLITLILLNVYMSLRKKPHLQTLVMVAIIPSIFSFVINILPFASTDGSVLLNLFI